MSQKYNIKRAAILIAIGLILVTGLHNCCEDCQNVKHPYLILYAFGAEGELLSHEMTIQDSAVILGRTVYSGRLADKDIVLAESGVGMTNAAMTTQRMIDQYQPKAVIFSGIAGAIDSAVAIGDIVACRQWYTHDYGYSGKDGFQVTGIEIYNARSDSMTRTSYFEADDIMLSIAAKINGLDTALGKIGERVPVLSVGGVGVSGNCFIDNSDKRIWLHDQFEALVTDMESAAVGQVCTVNDLPFIIFRSASDMAGGSGSETAGKELEQFFAVAADNSSKVVIRFLSELE